MHGRFQDSDHTNELDSDAAGNNCLHTEVIFFLSKFVLYDEFHSRSEHDSDDLEGAAAQPADPDTLGLATVHVDVSTHDAADDEVMKIVKKIAYELRQQNQQR